jgi:hypothetical protein
LSLGPPWDHRGGFRVIAPPAGQGLAGPHWPRLTWPLGPPAAEAPASSEAAPGGSGEARPREAATAATRQPQPSSAPPSAGISTLGCCRWPLRAPPSTQPTREEVPKVMRDPLRGRIDTLPDMISRRPISARRPDFAQTQALPRFPAGVPPLFGTQDRHTLQNEWPQWPQWPQADFRSLEQAVIWGHSWALPGATPFRVAPGPDYEHAPECNLG